MKIISATELAGLKEQNSIALEDLEEILMVKARQAAFDGCVGIEEHLNTQMIDLVTIAKAINDFEEVGYQVEAEYRVKECRLSVSW
ncbi:MAG: hypothetical protein AAF364_18275 [Pseudomonadota bacterium]